MASRSPQLKVAALMTVLVAPAVARAEEGAQERTLHWNTESAAADSVARTEPERNKDAAGALDDAQLMPFTIGAPAPRGVASVKTFGGYDTAAASARVRSAVDAAVFDFLALRLEYEHGPGTGSADRLTVGARGVALTEKKHGIDGGFGFFYDAKDFRNEGNLIAGLMLGRHFGRLSLYGNAFFGMDSEGDDQALDFRAGTGYRLSSAFQVGFDARGRVNMSTDTKRANAQAIGWEIQAAPVAAYSLGPIALMGVVGPSFLSVTDAGSTASRVRSGAIALGGVGAAF